MLCVSALKRGRGCGEVHTRCAWRAGGVWLARSLLDAAHVFGVGWVRGCRVWRSIAADMADECFGKECLFTMHKVRYKQSKLAGCSYAKRPPPAATRIWLSNVSTLMLQNCELRISSLTVTACLLSSCCCYHHASCTLAPLPQLRYASLSGRCDSRHSFYVLCNPSST